MRLSSYVVAVAVGLSPVALPAQSALPSNASPKLTTLDQHIDRSRMSAGVDSFTVFVQGKAMGWQRLSREADGPGWRLRDAVAVGAMVRQESVIRLGADLRERELRQEGTMGAKSMRIALDFAAKGAGTHVLGSADTPSNPAGTLAVDTVVAPGTVEDNAVTPLLSAIAWSAHREIAFPVLASGKGTVSTYHVRVIAPDTVTVPAGHFETWRVELGTGATVVVMQVTRAAPYRIVRMQPNGAPFDIQLAK